VTRNDKTFLLVAVTITVVVSTIIMLVGGAWWIGPALCVPLAVLAFVASRSQPHQEPMTPIVYTPPPPPPPPSPGSVHVQDIILPTADRDYRVFLHALVCWRPLTAALGGHPDQLAITAIIERAGQLTGAEPAGDYELVRNRLSTELAVAIPDRTGVVEAWAQNIALVLPDADLQRLRKLADVRKDEQVWEQQRDHERNKRAYLHDDVLKSTGSALVWWLAQDITKVSEAVALIGTLAQLSAAARDTRVDPLFLPFITAPLAADPAQLAGFLSRGGDGSDFPTNASDLLQDPGVDVAVVVRRLMDIAMPDSSEPDRARLADRLATELSNVDAHEVATRIREAFNAPDFGRSADDSTEDTSASPFTPENN
jgi:hypothetical protein